VLVVIENLVRTARIEVGQGGAMATDFEQPLAAAPRPPTPALAHEPLLQGFLRGDGDALSGLAGKVARQSIGLRIFDAEGHGLGTFYLIR
jgi:hypothetical protein